jgi:hypothetical protein
MRPAPAHSGAPANLRPPPAGHTRAGGPSRRRTPALAPVSRSAPGPAPREATPQPTAPRQARGDGGDTGGPDLGWALACLGLLLAAACIGTGRGGDGHERGRRERLGARERIAGLLRPLVGRR